MEIPLYSAIASAGSQIPRRITTHPREGGRRRPLTGVSLTLILFVLLLPSRSDAEEGIAAPPACPTGMTRSSGPPDTAIFAKAASAQIRAHWCERYDPMGISTRSGPYWEIYADGSIRTRATYVESRLTGPVVSFHESGELFLRGFLADGEWQGAFEIFHENGAAWFQANMSGGRLDGPVATFFPDGARESETRFQAGREDGRARSFFATTAGGRLKSEAQIEADAFVGEHRLLDRDGAVVRTIDWDAAPIGWRRTRRAGRRKPEPGPAPEARGEPSAARPASPGHNLRDAPR